MQYFFTFLTLSFIKIKLMADAGACVEMSCLPVQSSSPTEALPFKVSAQISPPKGNDSYLFFSARWCTDQVSLHCWMLSAFAPCRLTLSWVCVCVCVCTQHLLPQRTISRTAWLTTWSLTPCKACRKHLITICWTKRINLALCSPMGPQM